MSHPESQPEGPDFLPMEGEDYEVITSEEVDRIVAALDDLANSVESENIRAALEEASETIFSLIYEEGDFLEEDAA